MKIPPSITYVAAAFVVCAAVSAEAPVAIGGFGGLTIGMDRHGVLSVCRWPGPGSPDQLTYATDISTRADAGPPNGAEWGMNLGEEWMWLSEPGWSTFQGYAERSDAIMETVAGRPDNNVSVRVETFVLPGGDAFVSSFTLRGAIEAPRVAWRANFTPTTRHIPELPVGDWALDELNDFAAFVDRGGPMVWHFRPSAPGRDAWDRAEAAAAAPVTLGAWDEFHEGVWIAITGGPEVVQLGCASDDDPLVPPDRAQAALPVAAIGQTHSLIELTPEKAGESYHAWIMVGFGANRGQAYAELAPLRDRSVEELAARTLQRARSAGLPNFGDLSEDMKLYAARHRRSLVACRDRECERVVRSPSVSPALARDWPRYGAWIAHAFASSGDTTSARRQLARYLEAIQMEEREGRPFGSMPESFYTTGELASPHFIVDDRAVGRTLWATGNLMDAIDTQTARNFTRRYWPQIAAGADFLVAWADQRRGAPLWCEDPLQFADSVTQERIFDAYAGMAAAIRLASVADRAVPEPWRRRRNVLRELVEEVLTAPTADWSPGAPVLYEWEGLSAAARVVASEKTARRMTELTGLGGVEAGALLLQAVLLEPASPASQQVSEAMLQTGLRLSAPGSVDIVGHAPVAPDALVSSYALISLARWNERRNP